MDLFVKIPSLSSKIKFEESNGNVVIEYKEFIAFFLKHRLESEPLIRPSNILGELRTHKNGLEESGGKRYVKLSSFIRYVSKHYDQFQICQSILNEILNNLFSEKQYMSTLELYKEIAQLDTIVWSEELLSRTDIDESVTLYTAYKGHFKELEWKKICLFEFHYAKENIAISEYEREIENKERFLEKVKNIQALSQNAAKKCRELVQIQNKRKKTAEHINTLSFVHNGVMHSLPSVDYSLNQCLELYSVPCNGCTSVFDMTGIAEHEGIQLFVELKHSEQFDEVATILSCELAKKHSLTATNIVFVKQGTFENNSCKNCSPGNIHRFHLQDKYTKYKLLDNVLYNWIPSDTEALYDPVILLKKSGKKFCDCCFSQYEQWIEAPLDWRRVNVVHEWILHTPLEIQEFFTTCFFNENVVKKALNPEELKWRKLIRMYALLDTGLTLYNKKYSGILQQLNTQELVVNHHSVSTVFAITSSTGTTQSLKTADRWLKSAADEDKSYYETYMKQYPMTYQSIFNQSAQVHNVNLRQCYIIFFMDNLVRLSMHDDPDPGQNRTSQICTLPITLKGLPRDHIVTEKWHDEECERFSTTFCLCMEREKLGKEDTELLMKTTEDEENMWSDFNSLITWGSLQLSEFDELASSLPINKDTANISNTSSEIDGLDSAIKDFDFDETLEDIEQKLNSSLQLDSTVTEQQFVSEIETIDCNAIQDLSVASEGNRKLNNQTDSDMEQENREQNKSRMTIYEVPELLCRHPIPATGRDDDIVNLKAILKDTINKLRRTPEQKDKILFAPDHKISKNLLKLMQEDNFYQQFLPEFPALHLRKSKIVNLFAAYKKAGLVHLLKFMKDAEQEDDWMKLISIQHIETASKNITRLAVALHLALFMKFYEQLNNKNQRKLHKEIQTSEVSELETSWGRQLSAFVQTQSSRNATFALHTDFMLHCDEIVAIITAERLGGEKGYKLLLAAVKSSLPFAFLNGASSYASFCVDLLHEHYSAGIFHKNMKMALFSTPHRGGDTNIALDTQRELDHKDALKGFRPRSTMQSVLPRMAIVDHIIDVQLAKEHLNMSFQQNSDYEDTYDTQKINVDTSHINMALSKKDWKHVKPVVQLILQRNGFCSDECIIPHNVYECQVKALPCEILDSQSYGIGRFLIKKYAASQGLFGLSEDDVPNLSTLDGPSHLVRKAKLGKSITMRRINTNASIFLNQPNDKEELKRQADVKKKTKIIDCLSSTMNACQALVNPDGTKASIQKSQGIRKALITALKSTYNSVDGLEFEKIEGKLLEDNFLVSGYSNISNETKQSIRYATIEFAGVKFKTRATSGQHYLKHIENGVLRSLLLIFPKLTDIIICEEKYSFTPDILKSHTRKKRQKNETVSIAHLKQGEAIVSTHKMSKSAVLSTGEGKKLISNYLARNLSSLTIKRNVKVTVDSELITINCYCDSACSCYPYTHPIQASFGPDGFENQQVLDNIFQRKGEAELAQIDWLNTINEKLETNESVLAVVTSGDIDSIVAHLVAISIHWPRNADSSFKNSMYVLLQKSNPELYNITKIIQKFEETFGFKYAGVNVAIILCMGGNDFVPKMFGIGHERGLTAAMKIPEALKSIIQYEYDAEGKPKKAILDRVVYCDILKHLYCPKSVDPTTVSMQEVRQMSVKMPSKQFRPPTMWMPPESAIDCLNGLLNCVIEYMFTAWYHSATLPVFLGRGCLVKDQHGEVQYDFGNGSKVIDQKDLIVIDETLLMNKIQAGKKKSKRPLQTPDKEKQWKRKPMASTPIKMRIKKNAKKSLNLPNDPVNADDICFETDKMLVVAELP